MNSLPSSPVFSTLNFWTLILKAALLIRCSSFAISSCFGLSRLAVICSSSSKSASMLSAHATANFLALSCAIEIAAVSVSLSISLMNFLDGDSTPVWIPAFEVLQRKRVPSLPPV